MKMQLSFKPICFFTCAALVLSAAAPVLAQTLFTDNFDTGVSGASWQVMVNNPNYQILVGDNAHAFGAQSAKQVQANPFPHHIRLIAGSPPPPRTCASAHNLPSRCRPTLSPTTCDRSPGPTPRPAS